MKFISEDGDEKVLNAVAMRTGSEFLIGGYNIDSIILAMHRELKTYGIEDNEIYFRISASLGALYSGGLTAYVND